MVIDKIRKMSVKGVKLKSESYFSISPGILELYRVKESACDKRKRDCNPAKSQPSFDAHRQYLDVSLIRFTG